MQISLFRDMFVGMKIDRTRKEKPRMTVKMKTWSGKPDREKFSRGKPGLLHIKDQMGQRVKLFGGEPLHIFAKAEVGEGTATWDGLIQRELRFAVTHPPKNPYEEMIRWTQRGRLWKFPIDNEYGRPSCYPTYLDRT